MANNAPVTRISSKSEESLGMDKEDALKYRPNPDMLVSKLDQSAQVIDISNLISTVAKPVIHLAYLFLCTYRAL